MFIAFYRWKLKAGNEEQFRRAWSKVTLSIREQCGSLGSRLHQAEDGTWAAYAQWPLKEMWQAARTLAVLVLTKRYGAVGWEDDPLARILVSGRGIPKGSIKMAIQNYMHLMGKPGGLSRSSAKQRQLFRDYDKLSLEELRSKVERQLDKPAAER